MVAPSYDRWLGCLGAVSLAGWLILSSEVQAAEPPGFRCGESDRPWVELQFEGEGWDPRLQQSIRADLAAGLRLRGLLVCGPEKPGSEAPLASVQLSAAEMNRVAVEIEVHDALTNKYVLREVDMRNVPGDARGLTLAAAAEELLRASWAELALEGAPSPMREPPIEVTNAVRPAALERRDALSLGLRFAVEHHTGGQTGLGPDLWFDLWLSEYVATELSVGYRLGLTVPSEHGSIESQGAVFAADMLIAFAARRAPVLFGTRVGVQFAAFQYSGRANEQGEGEELTGIGAAARAALVLRVTLGDLAELRFEAGPGVTMRAVEAQDNGEGVTGTGGAMVHGELGFGVMF
ncbi:MAG TPA: hypothetical protein VJV78_37190 [Polyangiales bacterium]|nr:hypothetical protein [Polyangiales bacterium]